jgi:hypothetical protein
MERSLDYARDDSLTIIVMKYNDLNLQKIHEVPIFDVCSKLGITLYGMGKLTKRSTCWYHNDKHPSMHVNKKRNIYKCFVCGKGGDVIKLVQDYENKSFVEACDWLIDEFKVVVVPDAPTVPSSHPNLSPVLSSRPNGVSGEISRDTSTTLDMTLGVTSALCTLPTDLVSRSLSLDSQFCKSVVAERYLSKERLMTAVNRYRLGASKEGGVIFWEIDEQQRVRTGKIMYYKPDCHRDKGHNPTWVHSLMKSQLPADYELQHCLFGLHLLMEDGRGKMADGRKIAIVEAEKTAVIMSEIVPEFIWMSCGGLQMFNAELLGPLVNHKVVILPDTDETGEAYNKWMTVLKQAQRQYVFKYPLRISRLLEDHASAEQKKRKIDIVDFIFESNKD